LVKRQHLLMMKRWQRISLLVFSAILLGIPWSKTGIATERPERHTEIIVPYTEYEWWLISWSDNQAKCSILVDHEGLPTDDDVYVYCGKELYEDWYETEPCEPAVDEGESTTSCTGLYLHQVASTPQEKTVLVELPIPEAWITIVGCSPMPPENRCEELPSLIITGEEPLPNESIIQIQGIFNDIPFMCEGENCEVPLRPTPIEGAQVEFWADSSYGDSSEHYTALVRVTDSGVSVAPGTGGWFVDLMSSRWLGEQVGSCAQVWGTFPPVGGPPAWLSSPDFPQLLSSDEPYTYLAGRLITRGIVNANECPTGGLEDNGYANTCGLEKARTDVDTWQNRFDAQIVEVAHETGVPAQLIKNLFAQESQFWPGAFNDSKEFGLGQLTEMGADTVLLWNDDFFFQFCPLVLDTSVCELGYAQLSEEDQATLRGAVATQATADCPECPAGIDLTQADFSVRFFAQAMQANCEQVGQIVSNARGQIPGAVSNYEDLWRFTLVNYHAGPGCLSKAISKVSSGSALNWENLQTPLNAECPGVVEYVNTISD
jgi:hypothetical protein